MFTRSKVEESLTVPTWAHAESLLRDVAVSGEDEDERWRLQAMTACAGVLAQGVNGRDAVAQIRELVRLADGHLRVSGQLLKDVPPTLWADFAIERRASETGMVLLELSVTHPIFEKLPDLRAALPIDPTFRRQAHPEPPSAFLHRLSVYEHFASAGQKASLHAVMMMPPGASLIASLPTGWGKSALFQVGIRSWREHTPTATTVVIVPTVALAQDHARTLAKMPGLGGSAALVGGMRSSERGATLSRFRAGDVPVLLMSPEMALGGALDALHEAASCAGSGGDGAHLAAVVIDEAHVIASWGRHFRPDFQRLSGLVQELRTRHAGLRTLLLSATVNGPLRQRLRDDFAGGGMTAEVVVAEPRCEFDLVWSHVDSGVDRRALLLQVVDIIPRPAILYTTTVEDAGQLHGNLIERGYRRVELFTGEIDSPVERKRVIDSWANGSTDIVVATSAFGMGVDKANVRAIVHACLPESADRFYQEIGRAGRDGHQALSLCLWTDDDAAIAASLAIHGWMRPEMSTKRWKAILEEASRKEYVSPGAAGTLRIKIPLDARHEGLDRITGQLNRQWNAALLTLLQRSGALRIVSEEQTASGAELWVAQIIRPEIVTDDSNLEERLRPFLSIGAREAAEARIKSSALERALQNTDEGCLRTVLFDLVEPAGEPWFCGRCPVCLAAGEKPRTHSNRQRLDCAWPDRPWSAACSLITGAWVVSVDEGTPMVCLDRLVRQFSGLGVEQFIATTDLLASMARSVCDVKCDLGFTLLLGGDVPPARVPTAVFVGEDEGGFEATRKHCLTLRTRFETQWSEIPLLFVIGAESRMATLLQHVSSRAPIAEQQLPLIRKTS